MFISYCVHISYGILQFVHFLVCSSACSFHSVFVSMFISFFVRQHVRFILHLSPCLFHSLFKEYSSNSLICQYADSIPYCFRWTGSFRSCAKNTKCFKVRIQLLEIFSNSTILKETLGLKGHLPNEFRLDVLICF